MMKRMWISAVAAALLLIAAQPASADIVQFNFTLTGDQEVPPNNTEAVGAARFVYDDATQTFDLDLMVFGIGLGDLLGVGPNSTPVHIHTAPAGSNGPITFDLGFFSTFFDDGLGIRFQLFDQSITANQGGVPPVNPAEFEASLAAGDLYVNIHTSSFPGGEIRGQIIPAPGALAMLGAAGLLIGPRRRRG